MASSMGKMTATPAREPNTSAVRIIEGELVVMSLSRCVDGADYPFRAAQSHHPNG